MPDGVVLEPERLFEAVALADALAGARGELLAKLTRRVVRLIGLRGLLGFRGSIGFMGLIGNVGLKGSRFKIG